MIVEYLTVHVCVIPYIIHSSYDSYLYWLHGLTIVNAVSEHMGMQVSQCM